MPMQGVIVGFIAAVLVARASCHNIQYFRQLQPAVHAVPAHPAPPTVIHTTFPQKHAFLPAPLLPHRSFHQVLLPTVQRPPSPVHHPTYLVHPPYLPTKVLAAPQVAVPQPPPIVTQHRSVIVSSVLNHPTPQRQVVVPGYPHNLPVIVPSHPFVVVPDYYPRPAPVATLPLQPKFVQFLPTPPNIPNPPAPVKIQEVPVLPDPVPPKLSYVVHQHTKLVQLAPPPPPPPPPPAPVIRRLVPAAEVVQPVAAVHVTPVQQERQVHVIREVVRPTYVIERLSKKQRKFRKIKMLKNCSLLKKLKHQFGASAEHYELFDEPPSPFRQGAHWDAYGHVHHAPQSLGVEVYKPFHGHLPTFYKRKGR